MIDDQRLILAYLEVVQTVVLFARLRSEGENRLSDDHLYDLMDAIHNVPEFLAGTNKWFTPERMRTHLATYDEKWSENGGLHLVRILDDALAR